jgi:hypothetical protein
MQKLILVSILALTVILPAVAACEPNPRRALSKLLAWSAVGLLAYVLAVVFFYPRFGT